MTDYEYRDAYSRGEWPDDWDDEDIAYLATFLRTETNHRLFECPDADEWEWELVEKVDA